MPLTIGPSAWWLKTGESVNYYAKLCPVGTILPDGSRTICKAGGCAWIVAPCSTQVNMQWAGGQYNGAVCGTRCCISEWNCLQTQLTICGFNPSDWFVPSFSQLVTFSSCRDKWDPTAGIAYWSSNECNALNACFLVIPTPTVPCNLKSLTCNVRAFRCVTY